MVYAKMLIGKTITVTESLDKSLIGVSGRIADESRNMLLIEKTDYTRIRIPKAVVTIRVQRPNFRDYETLAGRDLIGTPQERIYKC